MMMAGYDGDVCVSFNKIYTFTAMHLAIFRAVQSAEPAMAYPVFAQTTAGLSVIAVNKPKQKSDPTVFALHFAIYVCGYYCESFRFGLFWLTECRVSDAESE